MSELYIGLMSGTSLDGVDGVLADLSGPQPSILRHAAAPFGETLRAELLSLNTSGTDELHRAALAANRLADTYAAVVGELLSQSGTRPADVRAVGAHGQTVRHRPQAFGGTGYTVQLNNPALLAERCGIDVVADFRGRDVAAGGQGAPLAPFFHRAVFARAGETVGVLNLGGISNLTLLRADGTMSGFDCGPGNALMDGWASQHTGQPYDAGGAWAASGRVVEPLLEAFLADPYFAKAPPKSTGRDLFHREWLEGHLRTVGNATAADVQATLCELTARACTADALRWGSDMKTLVVCGGGVLNGHLMQRLQSLLPDRNVISSIQRGVPPQQVEAAAFAWLAQRTVRREKLDLKSTTGAEGARVLGCIYPA